MDISWVRIESWHCVVGYIEGQEFKTLCGLRFGPMANLEVESRLGAERSCENCFRVLARQIDEEPGIEAEVEEDPAPAEPEEEEAAPPDYGPIDSIGVEKPWGSG